MAQIPGVTVVIAANHWQLAINVHNANHPGTDHAAVDLHREDPRYFPRTDVLWASPECTKWSQASGKARPAIEEGLFEDPLSDEATSRSRLLMFDVLRFAEHHRYRVLIVENVVDVATQAKYRLAWWEWRRQLTNLGYDFRVLSLNAMHAHQFGAPAPQSRDRIYIVAWRKGTPAPDLERVVRPRAYCTKCDFVVDARQSWKNGKTVGRYRQSYLYVHGDCGTIVEPFYAPALVAIDWSIPGEVIGDRLKDKTRRRIAAGIARYWGPIHLEAAGHTYDAADPKHPTYGDPGGYYRAWPVTDTLRTLHTVESKALAIPVEGRDGKDARPMGLPLRTQTTRNETGIAYPDLDPDIGPGVHPFIAELRGGGSTARPVTDPLATVTAGGNHHGLVTPAGSAWGQGAYPTGEPLRTVTTYDVNALVTPYYGNADTAHPVTRPVGTLTTVDRYALVHRNNSGGPEMTTPATEYLRTLTTAGHQSLIQAPADQDTSRPGRAGESGAGDGGRGAGAPSAADLRAAEDMVSSCRFRMLTHGEVAAGMAFPADYRWDARDNKGRAPSRRDLVKMAGNAVCPPAARDIMGVIAPALDGAA